MPTAGTPKSSQSGSNDGSDGQRWPRRDVARKLAVGCPSWPGFAVRTATTLSAGLRHRRNPILFGRCRRLILVGSSGRMPTFGVRLAVGSFGCGCCHIIYSASFRGRGVTPVPATPLQAFIDALRGAHFAMSDTARRAQASALDALGLGPHECDFEVLASGAHWRLRRYGRADTTPALLIVPAPIKRPYIWDLTPSVSAVRYCLHRGLGVHLLEWVPPANGAECAGLDEYAGHAISACVRSVSNAAGGARPFLIGHSLGGTLAAIFCALEPLSVQGLVLLGAPLCFQQASSRFRDALISIVPAALSETDIVPGSLLSQVSAVASPDTFLWSRWLDAALSLTDPTAADLHVRIERWALDEVALPGKLVNQLVQWLYRENRLCRGTLSVCHTTVGPARVRTPLLATVNAADEIGPLASVAPFIDQMATKDTEIIACPNEVGVGLQHLGMLAGRQAYLHVWPQIISWLKARN
jgi:polyhydroxyalkanoate synthase subunit PhaC